MKIPIALVYHEWIHLKGIKIMETKLVSIKQAAKLFNFPVNKLYRLVNERKCPFIELESLSGSITRKINTSTFAEWLDKLAKENKMI